MKQIVSRSIILIVMGCFLYGCGKYNGDKKRNTAEGFDKSVTKSEDEWVLYRSKDFSIQFPPLFKVDTSGYRKTRLILCSELTDDGDMYEDNIAVFIKDRENSLSLEAYGKQCEGEIMKYTESPELMNSSLKKKDGREYYEIIYSESQSTFRLIREQRIQFSGKKMYSVTLTCEDAVFDQCRNVGEAIMSTFTIK